MRLRRLRKEPAGLEITAFINLVVVLVPFLLSTAVFSRMSVIELSLPAQSTGAAEALKVEELKLEVVVRAQGIEVGDRLGGLIQRIALRDGAQDTATLSALLVSIKARFPDTVEATVLAEPETSYDTLVQVMDAMRATQQAQDGGRLATVDLFPKIAIGDAPLLKAVK
jgi:biopolymer transport protein ExbD